MDLLIKETATTKTSRPVDSRSVSDVKFSIKSNNPSEEKKEVTNQIDQLKISEVQSRTKLALSLIEKINDPLTRQKAMSYLISTNNVEIVINRAEQIISEQIGLRIEDASKGTNKENHPKDS